MMLIRQKNLLEDYYGSHRTKLNGKILFTSSFFLMLSLAWNILFRVMHLNFSRANIEIIGITVFLLLSMTLFNRVLTLSSRFVQQCVLTIILIVICCLYMGSGFKEAWGFFYSLPFIAALYGEFWVLLLYSILGLLSMSALLMIHPLVPQEIDPIDFSNIVLLYIILTAFSQVLLNQFNRLYQEQVDVINRSADEVVEQVVNSFIVAIEAKDTYTFGHSARVSQYAVKLASKLKEYQDPGKLKSLRLAGLLHDVGKINIPEQVLMKTGKLTASEYELVKTHAVVGARMVEKIEGLGSLKPGVLYHHEKWDGTGYPAGLKGVQIPLEARILGLADAFDAMTSMRSYKAPYTFEEAMHRLYQDSNRHFDPDLILLLQDVKEEWLRIYEADNDPLAELEELTNLI